MEKTKDLIRIEQQFLYTLAQVIESFPQYSIAQHLIHFLRKKSEAKEAYFWTPEKALQKLESYYDELKTDLLNDKESDYLYN